MIATRLGKRGHSPFLKKWTLPPPGSIVLVAARSCADLSPRAGSAGSLASEIEPLATQRVAPRTFELGGGSVLFLRKGECPLFGLD